MSDLPRKPTGRSDEARFARWAHDKIANQSKLGRVSGHRVINGPHGMMMVPSRGGGQSTPGDWYKIRAVEDDYIKARTWDGTNIGTEDILIAKPMELWCSVESEEVYGDTHTYTFSDDSDEPDNTDDEDYGEPIEGDAVHKLNKIRNVDDGTDNEDQRVIPPWKKGDVIYAVESLSTGVTVNGSELTLVYYQPSRMWCHLP